MSPHPHVGEHSENKDDTKGTEEKETIHSLKNAELEVFENQTGTSNIL